MSRSLLRTLPTVVASLALAAVSGQPVAPLVLAVLALTTALVPWRVPMDRATQRLSALVAVVLVIAAIRASGMGRGAALGAFGYGVALVPLVLASARLSLARPDGGPRVDVALGMLSLLATGGARPGLAYVGCWLAFLAAVVALSRARARTAVRSAICRRGRAGSRPLLGVAVLVAFGLIASIRCSSLCAAELSPCVREHVRAAAGARRYGVHRRSTSLLDSDEVVARVSGTGGASGAAVDRLRGVVLDRTRRAMGAGEARSPRARVVPRDAPPGRKVYEVRLVGWGNTRSSCRSTRDPSPPRR